MNLVKFLLPALAVFCLASCIGNTDSSNNSKKKEMEASDEEKIFVIHPLKDTSSIHKHLRPLTPYSDITSKNKLDDTLRRQLATDITMTYTSDTMKLHVKGDLCWIEYISAGTSSAKKKDGSYITGLGLASETTDTMRIR